MARETWLSRGVTKQAVVAGECDRRPRVRTPIPWFRDEDLLQVTERRPSRKWLDR